MAIDTYVQVAPDSTGKQVDMEQVATTAGATLYRQRAVLMGDTPELLWQISKTLSELLAVNRAQLAILAATSNVRIEEDDYYNRDFTEN